MEIFLTDENFEAEIANKDKPVLVDFFADWCAPCAAMAPILEEIAKDFEGRLILVKVDIDANPMIAQKFKINQMPTVILFNDGKPVSGFHGVRPGEIIEEWLETVLKEIKKTAIASTEYL